MNKSYVIALLLLGLSHLSYGYTVYLNNHTRSSQVDFYVHSSLAGCCEDMLCRGEGKCKVSLAAGSSGQFNMKDRHSVCKGACIACVTAQINTGSKTVEAKLNLAANSTIAAFKAIGSGAVAGAGGLAVGPEGGAVGLVGGTIAGIVVGAAEAIYYQCTDMEISISDGDNGGYKFDYKKR